MQEKETQKITITVAGDEGVEVASTNNFKVDKGSKWENIKTQAIEKAKVKERLIYYVVAIVLLVAAVGITKVIVSIGDSI